MTHYDESQVRLFLSTLFSEVKEGYVELRPINEDKSIQLYFDIQDGLEPLINKIQEFVGDYHMFVGINPRSKEQGSDESVHSLGGFWADIDAKDFSGDKSKAKKAISNLDMSPTMVIDSGNGYHAYWLLKNPWALDTEEEHLEAKTLSRAIHNLCDADSTHNVSRLLRIPGTPNIKDPNNSSNTTSNEALWKPCSLSTLNMNDKYEIKDFYNVIPQESLQENKISIPVDFSQNSRINQVADLEKYIPQPIMERAKDIPNFLEGDRSQNDYWIVSELYEEGFNDAEIKSSFDLFEECGWDAGNKYSKRGAKYLRMTMSKAKTKVNKLDSIVQAIEEADSLNKKRAAKGVWELIADLDPIDQEQAINRVQDAWGGRTSISKKAIRTQIKIISQAQNNTEDSSTFDFFIFNEMGVRSFIPQALAHHLHEESQYMFLASELYYYDNGVFKSSGSGYLKKRIIKHLGSDWKKAYREEVVNFVEDSTRTNVEELPDLEGTINVRNGMLDIETGKLSKHDPKYKSTVQFKVDYDPEACFERLDKFMEEVFTPSVVPLVWEHVGYILLKDLELKKSLILIGEGNNGKSVFLEVLTHLLGSDNISNETLQSLATEKFSTCQLFGKVANICADLDSEAVENTGTFKMLTGGDSIRAEVKFGDTFSFYNTAKLVFSANQLPAIYDYNDAFFERLHIVKCPNEFTGSDCDPHLIQKLTSKQAMSAFLNRGLEGARRLIKNNEFTVPDEVEQENLSYRMASDSVTEYIQTSLVPDAGGWEAKNTIYKVYKDWCQENNRKPVSKNKFSRRAQSEPNGLRDFRPQDGRTGEQITAWKGVKLQDMGSTNLEDNFKVNIK